MNDFGVSLCETYFISVLLCQNTTVVIPTGGRLPPVRFLKYSEQKLRLHIIH